MYGEVISHIATPELAGKKPKTQELLCTHALCLPKLRGTHQGCFGWTVVDGSCPRTLWPLGRGLLALQLPTTALLLLLKSYCTQIPGGVGGHVWEKQALNPSCREWEPLCLGYKYGRMRLINLAALCEECQCLLMRPQMSFCSTQRALLLLGWAG